MSVLSSTHPAAAERLPAGPWSALRRIRHVALDLDGTVYLANALLPDAKRFLSQLPAWSLSHSFITNSAVLSNQDLTQKLTERFGLAVDAKQTITAGDACLAWLHAHIARGQGLLVLGSESYQRQIQAGGYALWQAPTAQHPEPSAVVVATNPQADLQSLSRALRWLNHGVPWVATNPDPTCPLPNGETLLDCGAVCQMLSNVTGRTPNAFAGKPEPCMLAMVQKRFGVQANEILVVGDRLSTDMALAERRGAVGAFVLTGIDDEQTLHRSPIKPALVLQNLAELGRLLQLAKSTQSNPLHANGQAQIVQAQPPTRPATSHNQPKHTAKFNGCNQGKTARPHPITKR